MNNTIQAGRPYLARLLIVTAGIAPAFVCEPAWVIERFFPISQGSLDLPSSIDVGEVKPSEGRTLEIDLHNVAWRRISLKPVRSDCGCVTVGRSPQRIGAGGHSSCELTLHAPNTPGMFSRTVIVQADLDDHLAWPVIVCGNVVSTVWSEPPRLALTLNDDLASEAELVLNHAEDFQIDRLIPSSENIQVETINRNENRIRIRIRVAGDKERASQAGDASLYVFRKGNHSSPALTIPIKWSSLPKIGYLPHALDLPQFESEGAGRSIRRTVAILVPPERLAEDASLDVLVPWARIVQKTSDGSTMRIELEFDTATMPATFNTPILSVHLSDQSISRRLIARGYRS
jgi:hypothetical protein